MAYYLDQRAGTELSTLQDFEPTAEQAFSAQVGEAWESNPSVLGAEAFKIAAANRNGARLSAYDAGKLANEAGLREFAPGDGEYTREALDIVLERKREQRQRQDIIGRTPWSATGTPLRGLGMLAANLLDPLNVASAFVPVIGPARYSALLAGAAGAGGRAGLRAGVGAIEGAVGMALLEPAIYGARQYLDDDYTMSDSLLNIAFGGLLGGGLHVVGGGVADALSPGRWAAVRTLDDVAAQPNLPRPRTDAGTPAPGSAAEIAARATPEARHEAMGVSVAHLAEGKRPEVGPLFEFDRAAAMEDVRRMEAANLAAQERTEALEVMKGDIGWAQEGGRMIRSTDYSASDLDASGQPLRGAGEVIGRTSWVPKSEFWPGRPNQSLSQADAMRALEKAQRGERLGPREQQFVDYAVRVYRDQAEVARAAAREPDAERLAIQRVGSIEDVNADLNLLADSGAARAAAARQSAPESSITADFDAARAADERLAAAPKREDVTAATEMADAAVERYQRARADAEAAGVSPARLKAMDDAMTEVDAMVADAQKLGRAVEAAATCGARAL